MNLQQAMALGTAGLTAMLALMALEHQGVVAGDRGVLVTGATGGVCSIGVALIAAHGYEVTASTGREESHEYLRTLGATTILDRAAVTEPGPVVASRRPPRRSASRPRP